MNYYKNYTTKSVAEANSNFDVLIAHELSHLATEANVNFESGLNLDKKNVGVNDSHFPYEGGFTFFRYLAGQTNDFTIENTTDKSVQTFYGNDYIKNFVSSSKVITGAGKDEIFNYGSKKITINGGGKVIFDDVSESTQFNINGTKLKKQ